MTVEELKEKLEECPNDLQVFLRGFKKVNDLSVIRLSERHSKDWKQPREFVMLYVEEDMAESYVIKTENKSKKNSVWTITIPDDMDEVNLHIELFKLINNLRERFDKGKAPYNGKEPYAVPTDIYDMRTIEAIAQCRKGGVKVFENGLISIYIRITSKIEITLLQNDTGIFMDTYTAYRDNLWYGLCEKFHGQNMEIAVEDYYEGKRLMYSLKLCDENKNYPDDRYFAPLL